MYNLKMSAFSSDATFIDRDGGDLERNACELSTPCYPFYHGSGLPADVSLFVSSGVHSYCFMLKCSKIHAEN